MILQIKRADMFHLLPWVLPGYKHFNLNVTYYWLHITIIMLSLLFEKDNKNQPPKQNCNFQFYHPPFMSLFCFMPIQLVWDVPLLLSLIKGILIMATSHSFNIKQSSFLLIGFQQYMYQRCLSVRLNLGLNTIWWEDPGKECIKPSDC